MRPPCDPGTRRRVARAYPRTYVGIGSGWVPVGLAVFKTVAGRPSLSREGSTPSHSRTVLDVASARSRARRIRSHRAGPGANWLVRRRTMTSRAREPAHRLHVAQFVQSSI